MTASVPESFSMDELNAALESAPKDADIKSQIEKCEYSQEYIEQVADDALEFASSLVKDPLVHKVMAMMIVNRMVQWHTLIGDEQLKHDDQSSAVCWYRDAGKFQSMMDSLMMIAIGNNDFTCVSTDN